MRLYTKLALVAVLAGAHSFGALAQPLPPRSSFVSVNGGRLFMQECGNGPNTLLLIHDGVVDSAVWDDVWPSFCARFHVIRYDRRGYGRSPATTAPYTETDDVMAVLHKAGINHATVLGSSHGGEVAINFALAHPDAVSRLVLVGAVVTGFSYTQHFIDRGVANSAGFRRGDIPAGVRAWSNDRYLIAPGNDAARKKLFALLSANPQDMTHSDQIQPPEPALPRLGQIKVPTLVLDGDADIPDVHAHAGAIAAGIPHAQRVVLSGVGHIMYLEKPDLFVATVMGFLDANP